MIYLYKHDNNFYLKLMDMDTADFNTALFVIRNYHFTYENPYGYTNSNPLMLLDCYYELCDNFEGTLDSKVEEEINNYNPYVASFKSQRFNLDMSMFDKYPPFGQYQIDDIKKMVQGKRILNANKQGTGKAQPLSADILTNLGWKKMGGIHLEDLVATEEGTFKPVKKIFPQGKQPIYRLIFNDGSSTRCTSDHLWSYKTHNDIFNKKNTYRTCTTQDLIDKKIKYNTVYIPMVEPVQFEEKELGIDPWLMGVLIGNGSFLTGSVTFSTSYSFIVDKVNSKITDKNISIKERSHLNFAITSDIPKYSNYILNEIKKCGLLYKKSIDKFIPDNYKYASVQQRIELLTGLIDTDGYVDKKGYCLQYCTSSKLLKDDVIFIVQSLGGIATVSSKAPRIGNKEYAESYIITIRLPSNIIPISIPYKLERFIPKTKYPPRRILKSVEFDGIEEAQCISIDSKEHLYVTDNCIVTHNTYESVMTMYQLLEKNLIDKVLIIVIPSVIYDWKRALLEEFPLYCHEKDILIVTEENRDVFEHVENLPKVVILSYSTLRLASDYMWKLENPFKVLSATNKDIIKYCKQRKLKVDSIDLEKISKKIYQDRCSNYRKFQIDFSTWGTNRMLICDEAHRLVNMPTRWTQVVHKEKDFFDYRYPLSGTPHPKGIQDLYSPVKLLDDNLVDDNYTVFLHTLGDVGTSFSSYALKSIDPEKAKRFQERISPYLIRHTLRDVVDLPPIDFKRVYIPFEGKQQQLYQDIVNNQLVALKEEKGILRYKDVSTKFPYMLESLSDPCLLKDKIVNIETLTNWKFEDSLKYKMLMQIVTDEFEYDKEQKIIIWDIHPDTIDRLADKLSQYNPVVVHGQNTPKGKEKNKWRDEQVQIFRNDKKRKILIANPETLGTGKNLQFCKTVIFYSRSFSFVDYDQSFSRNERIGMIEGITYYLLLVDHSLDIHCDNVLKNRKLLDDLFTKPGLTLQDCKNIFAGSSMTT